MTHSAQITYSAALAAAAAAPVQQAADPAPDLAAVAERAHMAAACLARFGVPDLAACQHLATFPAWHADTVAAYRAAASAPVAELPEAAAPAPVAELASVATPTHYAIGQAWRLSLQLNFGAAPAVRLLARPMAATDPAPWLDATDSAPAGLLARLSARHAAALDAARACAVRQVADPAMVHAGEMPQPLRAGGLPPDLAELDLMTLHPDTVRAWPAPELARLLAEMENLNLHTDVSALRAMRHGTAADAAEGLAIVAEQARAGYLTPALAARRAALMARIAPPADEVPRDLPADEVPRDLPADEVPRDLAADKVPRDLQPCGALQITLTRAEGLVSECGRPVTVASFAQAYELLRDWSETAPKTGGYDKCDFLITWPDGDTYAGRYDLQHHTVDRPSLADHMIGLCDWYAGRAAPEHMTQDEYRARIAQDSHEAARAAYADIEQRLRAAGAWRDILRPVAVDLRAMMEAGKIEPGALLGAGVRYTGGHGPSAGEPDGCGAITAAEITQWGASLVVTLEDGRELISNGADFADSGRRPARFRIDWKRHGAPYLAQLAGAVAARKASQAAAETLRAQALQDERARLLAEYPHLQQPGDGRSNVATAAANIRAMLRDAFPGVKFSVRSSSYSGGNSITAEWTDGPTDAQVSEIVDRFRHGSFDSMDDSYNFSRDPWPELFGGTYYTTTKRRLSDAAVSAILEAEWPDAADRPTVQDYGTGNGRTHDYARRCRVHLEQNERNFSPCQA
jgi:hypothetical protein